MLEPELFGGSPKALTVAKETLVAFKKGIDSSLRQLEKSAASHTKVSDQTIAKNAYGQGFPAADDLSAAYERVHDDLKTLSQSLGDQLEALGIAVQCAHAGVQNVDAEQATQLRDIQDRTARQYEQYQARLHPQHTTPQAAPGHGDTAHL